MENSNEKVSVKCSHCGQRYSFAKERFATLPDIIGCNTCEKQFRTRKKEPVEELEEEAVAVIDESRWERLTLAISDVWLWIRSDARRSWLAFVLSLIAVTFVVKEFKAAAQANRKLVYMKEHSRLREEAENRLIELAKIHAKSSEPDIPQFVPKPKTPDPEPESPAEEPSTPRAFGAIELLKPDVESSAVPCDVVAKANPIEFTNGRATLSAPKMNSSWEHIRRNAVVSNGKLIVHHGGRAGLLSKYDVLSGILEYSIATRLIGDYELLCSPDCRFVAANRIGHQGQLVVIDTEKNEQILHQDDCSAIAFSSDGSLAVYLHKTKELRVWECGREPFEPRDEGFGVAQKLVFEKILTGKFIANDLLLIGKDDGQLVLVDWPMRTVVQQKDLKRPIVKIYKCEQTDRYLVDHGFLDKKSNLLGSGSNLLRWLDIHVSSVKTIATKGTQSEYTASIITAGHKTGAIPVVSPDCDRLAFLEVIPKGGKSKNVKSVCIYSMSTPNKLLTCIDKPMQGTHLNAFDPSGRYLFMVAPNDCYVVIDMEDKNATVIGKPTVTLPHPSRSRDARPDPMVLPVGDGHVATISNYGNVSLFRTDEAVVSATSSAKSNDVAVAQVLMSRDWKFGLGLGVHTDFKFVGYGNGILSLKDKSGERSRVPITRLQQFQRDIVAWSVGGPTDVSEWRFAHGGSVNQKRNVRLLRRESGNAVFDERGEQFVVKPGQMDPLSQLRLNALSIERFQACLPVAQDLRFDEVLSTSSLDGSWVINDATIFRYEVPEAYPDPNQRTITFQGNQVTFPEFSQPPGNVYFTNYRFVFYPREKVLFRCEDARNGDCKVTPIRFVRRGDSAEVYFPFSKKGMRVRRQSYINTAQASR